MKPKFKVRDMIKFYDKRTHEIFVEQIIKIYDNKYTIKPILPFDGCPPLNIECEFLEMESNNFTEASLLTDEEKLELL